MVSKESQFSSNASAKTNGHHDSALSKIPIAIVGMSCRFAGGIESPESLWHRASRGENMWSPMPEERFNSEGFYHPEAKRTDSTHIKGGYFLDEDISLFDHSFFGLTAPVASALDPQIRSLLEITYEALETAGITTKDIAGTKTSVYAGTFTKDYHDQLISDPSQIPSALIVGNYSAMTANRISHFFDLKGTSMALDTGCSTSMLGLHLATQSLRAGESECAIVGGAAMNIGAQSFIAVGGTGSCGPDGTCYSFDHRAQGYGRGEGSAIVILKRLDRALQDGNPIRAIVRETASNQDGHTSTITSPDADAQYKLIRECYAQADLDPLDTPVVEAHGTGTKVGDPIEASAIGRAMRAKRSGATEPIRMASVKTNIGHTEAVSGLASLIKMVKSLEEGKVAPSINFEKANPDIDLDSLGIRVVQKLEEWPMNQTRRASVNNFGYGGTNVHVILDAAPSSCRSEQIKRGEGINGISTNATSTNGMREQVNGDTPPQRPPARSKLFPLWAREEDAVRTMCTQLHSYLQEIPRTCFNDLIYTCGQRRTKHPWSIVVPALSSADLQQKLSDEQLIRPKRWLNHSAKLAFVFNGQGAQHFAMGRELMHAYPVYVECLQKCDEVIRNLGAWWSIVDELQRDEHNTRVNEVRYSMPMTCAVQISLVALLATWNINPLAVIGHSTGEIAAAYASGAITLADAMTASYYRGLVNADHIQAQKSPTGGMLAVGLGPEQVRPYLRAGVTIACYNSPESVTLSGDIAAVEAVEAEVKAAGGFARKLKVQAAFHSHHMEPLKDRYEALLNEAKSRSCKTQFEKGVKFFSAAAGTGMANANDVGPSLWVDNMLQPVRFTQALDELLREHPSVDIIVEVGAHPALAGPLRQTLAQPDFKHLDIRYDSCLERGKDAVDTMQTLAGMLLQAGHPVSLANVNFPLHEQPNTLSDLPAYPWTHKTKLWIEPRQSYERRFRQSPPHDLLGVQMSGLSSAASIWKHVIRPSEVPWVRDHVVQGQIIYPGAGYIAMAIEAVRQVREEQGESVCGYLLRDVEISRALALKDDLGGVEVQLSLESVDERFLDTSWRRFRISSAVETNGGTWSQLATGLIQAQRVTGPQSKAYQLRGSQDVSSPAKSGQQTRHFRTKNLFDMLQRHNIDHGPIFRNLHKNAILAGNRAAVTFDIADAASVMPEGHQEPHVIHPTTLDSVFLALYLSLHASRTTDQIHRMGGPVPRSIKRMFVSADIGTAPGTNFSARTLLRQASTRGFTAAAVVEDAANTEKSHPLIEIEDMLLQSLGHHDTSSDNSTTSSSDEELCLTTEWKRSFILNSPDNLVDSIRGYAPDDECRLDKDLIRATYFVVTDALRQLTESDVASLQPHHRKYHEWMQNFVAAAENDGLGKGSAKWASSPPGLKQKLIESVANRVPNGQLAMRIGTNLPGILRKEIAPLELMLKDNLLNDYYQDTPRSIRSAQQSAALIRAIAEEKPCVRILEIGGGTASYSQQILTALTDDDSQLFSHYSFSDISAGFFAAARQKLAAWGGSVSYTTLDIESDPSMQGFELGSYDIIVAGLVLHATKSVNTTLANVRKLLKEHGKLVMIETTREPPEFSLIFGALPGWWLSEEPERRYGPNMDLKTWDAHLKEAGFTGVDVSVWDCEQEQHQAVSSIVATNGSNGDLQLGDTATLVYEQELLDQVWIQGLRDRFARELSVDLAVQSLPAVQPDAQETYILLLDHDTSSQDFDEATFDRIKKVVTTCKSLLWVTAGSAVEAKVPEKAIHHGLLRTARLEESGRRYVSLDLDPETARFSAENAAAIFDIFKHTMDARHQLNDDLDQEYAVRESQVLIPRITPDRHENRALLDIMKEQEPEMQPFLQNDNAQQSSVRLTVDTPGLVDSIVFREDIEASQPLREDIVEVEPHAFGLNFKDVMGIMGMLSDPNQPIGIECAGVVTRMGPKRVNQGIEVGHRVACLLPHGHIASSVRTPSTSVARIPDSMTFEQAAAVPVVFLTAWYSLFDVGQSQPEDTVLIHAATGGVGQACIILAQWKGIQNILVTAGTPEKRDMLRTTYGILQDRIFSSRDESFVHGVLEATNGRGVDVVVNSLSGNLLSSSFNVLAPHGRFVEIGKRDIVTNRSLDMLAFNNGTSFTHVDMQLMALNRGPTVQRMLREIFKLMSTGQIQGVTPVKTYSFDELPRAVRTMQAGQHMGKLVLAPRVNDLVKTIPPPPRAKLDRDASYLVVGGASGLGLSIAQLLIDRGARHLLLVSRNATSRPVSFNGDVNVTARDCDVSDKAAVLKLLEDHRQSRLPPVKGVVYCGMVLDDAFLQRMSYTQWSRAFRPKVHGTRNVHEALGNEVDFFIMLSSLSGVLGYPSQSNYAAGNTYQDALARHRTANGLPAVAIDLGSVGSLGYLVDGNLDGTADRVAKYQGRQSLTEAEVLGLVEAAILRPLRTILTCQLMAGLSGSGTAAQRDARCARLRQRIIQQQTSSTSSGARPQTATAAKHLSQEIAAVESSEEAASLATNALVAKIADMFALPPSEVNPAGALKDFGVDSLVAVELRNWLTANARVDISIFQLLDSPSLEALASSIVELSRREK